MTTAISSSVKFHNVDVPLPVMEGIPDSYNGVFGVLTYNIGESQITQKNVYCVITVDQSGSMEVSSKGITRMTAAKLTVCNTLRYLADIREKHGTVVFVHVIGFDDTINMITPVHDFVEITSADVEQWCIEINAKLYSRGSTNVEIAFATAHRHIAKAYDESPDCEFIHMFLTDGEITAGSANVDYLRTLLHPCCNNVMIGMSSSHNAKVLYSLATSTPNPLISHTDDEDHVLPMTHNGYRFIDDIENSACVYSDILYDVFYGVCRRSTIRMKYAQIYDSEKDVWTNELTVGTMCAEKTYKYYVTSETPNQIECTLFGETETNVVRESTYYINMFDIPPPLICNNDNTIDSHIVHADCTISWLTFNTMKLLSVIKNRPYYECDDIDKCNALKKQLTQMFRVIGSHRELVIHDEIAFKQLKTLEDDIYIAHKTMDTAQSMMYCVSRNTTQLRQCSYNPTNIDTNIDVDNTNIHGLPTPILRVNALRNNAFPMRHNAFNVPDAHDSKNMMHTAPGTSYEEEDDIHLLSEDTDADLFKGYTTMASTDTANRTPTLSAVIRQVSGGTK